MRYIKLLILILITSSITLNGCKILKKKKKCDCPEWSNINKLKSKQIVLKNTYEKKSNYS